MILQECVKKVEVAVSLEVDSSDCTGIRIEWMLILRETSENIRKIGCIFRIFIEESTFARKFTHRRR